MRLVSNGQEETEEIGFRLGRRLREGDVVGLYGDLGAGKTTMVRGIARAFGIAGRDITSASFTLVAEYPADPPFFHIDLYRLETEEDVDLAGIWEYLGRGAVSVVEWAERLGEGVKRLDRFIGVSIIDTGRGAREISIEGIDEEDRRHL